MALNTGRNVGHLSIRVVPDTKKFRNELRDQLRTIERTTRMTVNVDKARLNNQKIREDIRQQMADMQKVEIDADVRVTIDKAKLKKTALRKSIQEQFDQFQDIRVKIAAEIANVEAFEKDVRDMVQRASRNQVKITANAFTAIASRQLAFVGRDRIVNLIVRVSKASMTTALTTLAALSGARLSWKWIDDLMTSMKNLDKNLPSIIGWTTGITSLIAAITAATGGIVGIGQGLFSILPAFLVLPGLLLNAVGSVTALFVALKNTSKELAPLKDDMSELGDIINEAFWGKARQPILDLVNGLMPQLRVAFHDLSLGIGEFTAAMSKAFGEELANGRLASIFKGIADGWRVLGTGASGFAGALVSLSQIAAQYTPRLAHWFVRQANTFDAWLKAISEDGRLGAWMEDAIDSMYDVWDVTRGVAGVFEGLWKAADAAGSGGLKGFAQLMLTWDRIVNGADFQRGLEAIFRGSSTAMSAFGDAVRAIGRLVADLDGAFETFIGSAGTFLGGLIEGAANALNQPSVDEGLLRFSDGLVDALNGVLPYLPRIGETFGNFLGLLGDLAGTVLPTAASALEALMPSIDNLIGAVETVLPDLADATSAVIDELGPAVEDLVTALSPALVSALEAFADVAPPLAAALNALVDMLKPFLDILAGFWDGWSGFIDALSNNPMSWLWDEQALNKTVDDLQDKGGWLGGLFDWAEDFDKGFAEFLSGGTEEAKTKAAEAAAGYASEYRRVLESEGKWAADTFLRNLSGSVPKDVIDTIREQLKFDIEIKPKNELSTIERGAIDTAVKFVADAFKKGGSDNATDVWNSWVMGMGGEKDPISPELRYWIAQGIEDLGVELNDSATGAGGGFSRGLADGIAFGYPSVDAEVKNLRDGIGRSMGDTSTLLTDKGRLAVGGFRGGLVAGIPGVEEDARSLNGRLNSALSTAGTWLPEKGRAAMGGLRDGANEGKPGVIGVFSGLNGSIRGAVSGINLYGVGSNLMGGLAAGMRSQIIAVANTAAAVVRNAVAAAERAGEIHSPSRLTARKIGQPLVQGIAVGINKDARLVNQSMTRAIDLSDVSGKSPTLTANGGGGTSGVNLHIHNPVVRDLRAEAWEAAQLAGQVL